MKLSRRSLLNTLAATPWLTAKAVADTWKWNAVPKVVAIGDIHGDFDALSAVLKMAGVIDEAQRWTGGAAHVVQVGDIPARGPQTRDAFDLLMRLEQESAAAGGQVHALIGNHDAMPMYGEIRGITKEEYAQFRTPQSEALLTELMEKELAEGKKLGKAPTEPAALASWRARWMEDHPPGFVEHQQAFQPGSKYGDWIRSHQPIIQIGDTLFMHGGISPKYADRTISSLNDTIHRELANPSALPPGLTTDTEGPLWYRGLSEGDEKPLAAHVAKLLQKFGLARIVVGHSVTKTAILPRFGGRVINLDLGLSRFYGRPPSCLLIEDGKPIVLFAGQGVPVPGPEPAAYRGYLEALVKIEGAESPIARLLKQA